MVGRTTPWPHPLLRWVYLGHALLYALPAVLLGVGLVSVLRETGLIPVELLQQAIVEFLVLTAIVTFTFAELALRRARIILHKDSIEVTRGFFAPRRSIVPLESIQAIQVQQGIWSRCFGISKLTLTTSSGKVKIEGVKDVAAARAVLRKDGPR